MATIGSEIANKVRVAAKATVKRLEAPVEAETPRVDALITSTHKVIAIGTSTGGTQALAQVLPKLPANTPGIVVVVHMPAGFTGRFANRLNEQCQMDVKEAQPSDMIIPGRILIAPGNQHMTVRRSGARYMISTNDDPPVNQFRPSVDVMMQSCAKYIGSNAVGVILTGMGNDGAQGLLAMKQAGAVTFAQDEQSSVVYGMPKEAYRVGAVDKVLPLDKVADAILEEARRMAKEVSY